MKNIHFYPLALLLLIYSCDEKALTEINKDVKNANEVPASSLFSSAEKSLTEQMVNSNVNNNIFRLVNQQWTETTYLEESNYYWSSRKISDRHWNALYLGSLTDLKAAKSSIDKVEILATHPDFATKTAIKKNQLALVDLLMVYCYQILVDSFGDIPYLEALQAQANYSPKYDKAVSIYKDLLLRLDMDLANINPKASAFGEADLIYQDNMAYWIKFAHSLKLKIALNLKASNLESAIADKAILSAAAGAIKSNAENAKFKYMSSLPNTNPIFADLVLSGRNDFVAAAPFVTALIARKDPRLKAFFDDNVKPYKGGIVGKKNEFGTYTHMNPKILQPDYPATLLDYSETEFLLAEAIARGIKIGGSIESHYNSAILASMEDWGISKAEADIYLVQTSVAYQTAKGSWQQKIGEQSWLAKFNRGFEGWTSTRRLNYPQLIPPPTANQAAEGEVPSRMTYPIEEQTLNSKNYQAAAAAIGGDQLKTKIFWDVD